MCRYNNIIILSFGKITLKISYNVFTLRAYLARNVIVKDLLRFETYTIVEFKRGKLYSRCTCEGLNVQENEL